MTLPRELESMIVLPADRRYPMLRSTFTRTCRPAMVMLPANTAEVVAALRFARDQDLPVAVRSGGHGPAGRASNDGGVVIDLSRLDDVRVLDRSRRLVRVGPGARWATVARELSPQGLAISSGDHGNVGVGGSSISGGIGWLARHWGMTVDHVRAAEVVLADGRIVRADASTEPDLFWAIRGAGVGVGIVTALEIEAAELRDVGVIRMTLLADREGEAIRRLVTYMTGAPRELSAAGMLMPYGGEAILSTTAVYAGDDVRLMRKAVAPLRHLSSGLIKQHIQRVPYSALLPCEQLEPNTGQRPGTTTNGLLHAMTPPAAEAISAAVFAPTPTLIQLRSAGGAINDVPPDATAFAHRNHEVLVIGSVFPPQDSGALDTLWDEIAPHMDGSYFGFESRPDAAAFRRCFPGATGDRVLELWRRYDPDEIFRPPGL
ncbi:FAD-binding oxidoreductase [Actinoplanes solisilvae]|uniref:FAD-binding oxidoreductase n=1 Tax=Actinoplanes solisilvae TaxID=2486853 RepID=UPI000FD7E273|nr:FAD-binding oxidoreductase [Actinoplanes solisilvae]